MYCQRGLDFLLPHFMHGRVHEPAFLVFDVWYFAAV